MNKFLKTLQTLSKNEFQAFDRYIHSPYFCQHEETLLLFDLVKTHFPDFEHLSLEKLRSQHPSVQLSRARYNVLNNYLYTHLLNFLAQLNFESHPLLRETLTIESLWQRNHYHEAQKLLKSTRETVDQAPHGSSLLLSRLKIEEIQLDLNLSTEMRDASTPLGELFEIIDQVEAGFRLKYLLPSWTLHRLYGQDFPESAWLSLKQRLQAAPDRLPPLTCMYYHLLNLIREEEVDRHREALLGLLKEYGDRLSKVELMNVYGYLQNHLTHQILRGDPQAYSRLFKVYQKLEQHDLIFGRGEFSRHLIRNITITGCRLGRLTWTRQFLSNYRKEIEGELGNNAYPFSLAYLEFASGAYDKALKNLQKMDFVDTFYRIGHQSLLLRIYYELNDFESLLALSATFRRYLNRNNLLSEAQKEHSRKFISVIRQLVRAKETGLDQRLSKKIEDMLQSSGRVTDKDWLKAKLEELK